MLAPLTPHVAEELWERLGHDGTIAYEPFPVADPEWLVEETVVLPVQVNGKVRARVTVDAGLSDDDLRERVLADPAVKAHVEGKSIRKVIVGKGPLVSVVVS
jgi:leucyl-tRNA synthetase